MTGASGKVDRNLFHPAIHNRWHIVSDLFDTRARGSERNSTLRFIHRFSFVFFLKEMGGTRDQRTGHTSKALKAQLIARRAQASPAAYVDKDCS